MRPDCNFASLPHASIFGDRGSWNVAAIPRTAIYINVHLHDGPHCLFSFYSFLSCIHDVDGSVGGGDRGSEEERL